MHRCSTVVCHNVLSFQTIPFRVIIQQPLSPANKGPPPSSQTTRLIVGSCSSCSCSHSRKCGNSCSYSCSCSFSYSCSCSWWLQLLLQLQLMQLQLHSLPESSGGKIAHPIFPNLGEDGITFQRAPGNRDTRHANLLCIVAIFMDDPRRARHRLIHACNGFAATICNNAMSNTVVDSNPLPYTSLPRPRPPFPPRP